MYVGNIKTELPLARVPQKTGLDWIAERKGLTGDRELALMYRVSCQPKDIARRHTALPDFLPGGVSFFADGSPLLSQRMHLYKKEVERAVDALGVTSGDIEHIIHVSCTGYTSPTPIQRLLSDKNLNDIGTTNLYHMGCYAAIPAVRVARGLAWDYKVRVVHNELCTLHFQMDETKAEQYVIQSLFADGHCSYDVSPTPYQGSCFAIEAICERRAPKTLEHMTWDITEQGFKMSLDRSVPQYLSDCILDFLSELRAKVNFRNEDCIFAIHPGGPKIISTLADKLVLRDWQIAHSKDVLFNYGNMSSATVPFIWKRILDERELKKGMRVISLAFGPGLSLLGSVFRLT